MTHVEPLPFRLRLPGEDSIDAEGARSISYRLEGLLHLEGDAVTLEWTATRRTQLVGFGEVKDEVDESPVGTIEIPVDWLTQVRRRGGWWAPRLQLRARRLHAFEGLPGAQPTLLTLRIRRRDRTHADATAAAIVAVRDAAAEGS
jgi:hypothetical protein